MARDGSEGGTTSADQAAAAPKVKKTKYSKKGGTTVGLKAAAKTEACASSGRTLFLHTSLKAVPGVWERECTIVVFKNQLDNVLKAKKRGDLKVAPAERAYQFDGRNWAPQCWKCLWEALSFMHASKTCKGELRAPGMRVRTAPT